MIDAAVDYIDSWITAEKVAALAGLPAPFASGTTTPQKAALFGFAFDKVTG